MQSSYVTLNKNFILKLMVLLLLFNKLYLLFNINSFLERKNVVLILKKIGFLRNIIFLV